MREAIGSTWIYQLVIIFILIFVSFLILALTYSKSFKTKNEVLNIIEKYEGVTPDSITIINNYLKYSGYKTTGHCPNDKKLWAGSLDLSNNTVVKATSNQKYYYCIRKISAGKSQYYYEVELFFKFNVPILGNLSTFTVDGETGNVFKNKNDVFYKLK